MTIAPLFFGGEGGEGGSLITIFANSSVHERVLDASTSVQEDLPKQQHML